MSKQCPTDRNPERWPAFPARWSTQRRPVRPDDEDSTDCRYISPCIPPRLTALPAARESSRCDQSRSSFRIPDLFTFHFRSCVQSRQSSFEAFLHACDRHRLMGAKPPGLRVGISFKLTRVWQSPVVRFMKRTSLHLPRRFPWANPLLLSWQLRVQPLCSTSVRIS